MVLFERTDGKDVRSPTIICCVVILGSNIFSIDEVQESIVFVPTEFVVVSMDEGQSTVEYMVPCTCTFSIPLGFFCQEYLVMVVACGSNAASE